MHTVIQPLVMVVEDIPVSDSQAFKYQHAYPKMIHIWLNGILVITFLFICLLASL